MLSDIIIILWLHWVGDFPLQSDYMAVNKSKELKPLVLHCLAYSLPFFLFGWKFALLAGLLHFPIDFVTSKITSKLWELKETHWFFVIIGLDQAVHLTILLNMLKYL